MRTKRLLLAIPAILSLLCAQEGGGQGDRPRKEKGGRAGGALQVDRGELHGNVLLSAPGADGVSMNVILAEGSESLVEYGKTGGPFTGKTPAQTAKGAEPLLFTLTGLETDTAYSYRLRIRRGAGEFDGATQGSFHTKRGAGASFAFGVQGDSHPERTGKMFSAELYELTMKAAAARRPDFYFILGDDFSIEHLIEKQQATAASVDGVYLVQRRFLGSRGVGVPIFPVNGNHEQAARYLLDGTESSPAVLAALSRIRFYSPPAPGGIYTGDLASVEPVGLLRDYFAFEWGDALFVTLDPYWHSQGVVDNRAGDRGGAGRGERGEKGEGKGHGGGKGARDLWQNTLGEAQYRWLAATLMGSKARWKFVFTHHINGTGRGGIENASLFEWGGKGQNGADEFAQKRPGWGLPIHRLFVEAKVTILFQGHDHLFARQDLDGVVYQSLPNPADDTYTAFNRDAYCSGEVRPNSGFLHVSVGPSQVKVDYLRSFLPKDEGEGKRHGDVAYSYTIP